MALVDRSQRPLRATRAGDVLRPHVERVLAALGGAEAAVEDCAAATPRLRLAAFPSALSSFVPAAVRDLRRAHSELVVQGAPARDARGDRAPPRRRRRPRGRAPHAGGGRARDGGPAAAPPARRPPLRGAARGPPARATRRREHRRPGGGAADPPAARHTRRRFRSVVEHLCAQAGFAPRVAYELDDLPAAQAFVAAGIAIVPMHGLTLATVPPGATARPLAERPPAAARSRRSRRPQRARRWSTIYLDSLWSPPAPTRRDGAESGESECAKREELQRPRGAACESGCASYSAIGNWGWAGTRRTHGLPRRVTRNSSPATVRSMYQPKWLRNWWAPTCSVLASARKEWS